MYVEYHANQNIQELEVNQVIFEKENEIFPCISCKMLNPCILLQMDTQKINLDSTLLCPETQRPLDALCKE